MGPAGTTTLHGATAPTLAGAGRVLLSKTSRTSPSDPEQKTKPTLPRQHSSSLMTLGANSGFSSQNSRMTLRIMVFFPIKISALPRNAIRVSWICFDPTLSI